MACILVRRGTDLLHLLLALVLAIVLISPGRLAAAATTQALGAAPTENPASVVTLPSGARVSERIFGLAGLSNVGRVAPGVYRGDQPLPEGYRTLRAMGIRTVVNLRTRHGEKAAVESAGMRSIEIPISTTSTIDPKAVKRALSAITDPANQPLFLHCAQGRDRTGVVVAVYRMEIDGWKSVEAEAEMQTFGFHDAWVQMKSFVRSYRADSRKGATP
jgi:protein tyrosine/serine phosphatase